MHANIFKPAHMHAYIQIAQVSKCKIFIKHVKALYNSATDFTNGTRG